MENISEASKKSTNLVLQPDSAMHVKEPFKVTQNKRDHRGLIKKMINSTKVAKFQEINFKFRTYVYHVKAG